MVTSTKRLALIEGGIGIKVMILAALGRNAAWGIVDGIVYVFTIIMDRGKRTQLILLIKSVEHENMALRAPEQELESSIVSMLDEREKRRASAEVLKSIASASLEKVHTTKDDVYDTISSFLLVFFTAFAVAIPILIIRNLSMSLGTSNLVAIGMLFAIGHQWAGYANRSRFKTGITIVLTGAAMLVVCLLLGG